MTDRAKFEQMLEYLINEDQEKAKEVFHDIVVAKSREIYESLLAEDFEDSELEEASDDDEDMEESMEDDEVEEGFGMELEAGPEDEMGGDPADDLLGDIEYDSEGGEDDMMGGEEDLEDRVVDLEDALEELKAEFEELMAGEEGEGQDEMDDEGGDDFGDDKENKESLGFEDMETDEFEESLMREYVEKVSVPKGGDNGANAKSVVAGKNDMGGTVANIARGGEAKGEGTKGGLLKPSTQLQDGGNINKPGANAGKTAFKKKEPGHGAEKKGSGESADNKKSIVGSR